ncbi:unnamed protein product [Sphenostylis stenocarpa]|uniref:TIR domain-containing protein n=1 Tax=Sphenostylis stenocarpa TaxID=92480 RepID=A0AA86SAZ4_9FABA|nr:unnamed protein product [Sphenostylis stenocarpa]
MKLEQQMRAIARSKIEIIVFSKTYTESTWCVRELEKIIECYKTFGQIVLPVYYEIDPHDIARQKGDFGKALKKAAQKIYSGKELKHALSRWRLALTRAAGITGWDARKFRHDAELVKDIVDRIQILLDYKYLPIAEYPVGLESHVEKVIGCIENQSTNVCIIGIWGMGGSGKTLLAKAIYNRIYRTFIDRGYVTEILNGCGLHADIGITVLIERSLLKVDKNNKLQMHPLLRDMGREIIRERSPVKLGNRSRLWCRDDVEDGTQATEGLSLKLPLTIRDCFEAHAFKTMERLRLLQLDHVHVSGSYEYFSKQLRWICWQWFPSKYIPNNFNMENVIALDLKHSHLRIVWKQSQVLSSLKFLNLSHSYNLTETPDFSGLPSLEELILKDCPSLCKIHQSIGDLCNLLLINLKDCTSLSSLPREIYKLKSLKTLVLSGCSNIDILEEDIVQMKSLITLITENKAVKQVPLSIISSKCIGYISLRGFEGLLHIFPSIIRSWKTPISNPLSYTHPFGMDMENNNWRYLSPFFTGLANLRSVLVQCDTEFQLSTQVQTIRVEYGVNYTELRISEHHLRFSLIGVGGYDKFFNTLSNSISEEMARCESCDICLPGDNHPYWFGHVGEGHSVFFTLPQDCHVKGMALCVVYSSTPDIIATECLKSVLIVNYTKFTFQIHKHGTIISDIDWQGIISNLGSGGDKVEIFVAFGDGLVVKKTAVYLIYSEPNDFELEPWREPEENALYKFIKKIVLCECW